MPRLSVSAGVSLKSSWTNSAMRLCRCVHGSAALPRPLLDTWSSRKSANGESDERAAVPEQAEQPVVPRVEPLLDVVQKLAAALDRVTALEPGQLLVDLIRLVERVGVARASAQRRQAVAKPDRAEARDGLTSRDPERRVAVPDAGPVQRVGHGGDLVVPDEQLVDERRADDAVPVERQIAKRRGGHVAKEQRDCPLVVPRLVLGVREASEDLVVV